MLDNEWRPFYQYLMKKLGVCLENCSYCVSLFQRKMEEHLANVRDFHAMLKIHTDWLSNAEKILGSFKHPSKIVDRVLNQIQDHRVSMQDTAMA